MKPIYLIVVLLGVWASIWLAIPGNRTALRMNPAAYVIAKKSGVIACAPDRTDPDLLPDNPLDMIPLPGWGNYRWPKVSTIDSAQFYFNQGINLYYSFHIVEALSSFRKAACLDTASAMAQWGIALSYGPNINDVVYNYSPLALDAAQKAAALSSKLGPFEKGLITAMLARYTDDPGIPRSQLDLAYTNAMKQVHMQFPGNPDAGALYADALMLLHPWDLYDQHQQPKPWTPELVAAIEQTLEISPGHPGANHYYIHAVEASATPERAVSSADKLGNLLPGVAHMVHMPSHIYIRTGMYEKGHKVNKDAIEGYRKYKSLLPTVENGAFLYLFHNLHMQATCAMAKGDYMDALKASEQLEEEIPKEYLGSAPPDAEYLQYMFMTKTFTDIRFGKWNDLLELRSFPDSVLYAKILYEFGRSIAFSRRKNFDESRRSIRQMENILLSSERLKKRMGAFNTAFEGGDIAIAFAKGVMAEEMENYTEAAAWLEKAVSLEDRMVYNEPKDWLLPPRQYLGAIYLKAGKAAEAETTFREDLAFNPHNGWSLKGLSMALKAQRKESAWQKAEQEWNQTSKSRNFNANGPVF